MRTFAEIEATRPKGDHGLYTWFTGLTPEDSAIWDAGIRAQEAVQEAYSRKLWKFLLREGEVDREDKADFDPADWASQYKWDEDFDDFVEVEDDTDEAVSP